jgi:hypothetical protein
MTVKIHISTQLELFSEEEAGGASCKSNKNSCSRTPINYPCRTSMTDRAGATSQAKIQENLSCLLKISALSYSRISRAIPALKKMPVNR